MNVFEKSNSQLFIDMLNEVLEITSKIFEDSTLAALTIKNLIDAIEANSRAIDENFIESHGYSQLVKSTIMACFNKKSITLKSDYSNYSYKLNSFINTLDEYFYNIPPTIIEKMKINIIDYYSSLANFATSSKEINDKEIIKKITELTYSKSLETSKINSCDPLTWDTNKFKGFSLNKLICEINNKTFNVSNLLDTIIKELKNSIKDREPYYDMYLGIAGCTRFCISKNYIDNSTVIRYAYIKSEIPLPGILKIDMSDENINTLKKIGFKDIDFENLKIIYEKKY